MNSQKQIKRIWKDLASMTKTAAKKAAPAKNTKAAPKAKKVPAKKPASKIEKKPKAAAKKVSVVRAKQAAATKKPSPAKKASTPKSKVATPAKKSASKSTPNLKSSAKATPKQTKQTKKSDQKMGTCCNSTSNNNGSRTTQSRTPTLVDKYIRYPDAICANDFVAPNHDKVYRDSIEN